MIYNIINAGNSRDLFYDGQMYYIARNEVFPTDNLGLAKEAAKLPLISVEADVLVVKQVATKIANVVFSGIERNSLKKEVVV